MNVTPTDLLPPAEKLTTEEALAERERLRDDLAKLARVVDEASARDREIKAEVIAINKELADQRLEAARNGEQVSESSARKELAALENQAADVAGSIQAAKVMREKVETELHYLHVQQFEAFAEHAEELGTEATKALKDLRPQYEETVRRWNVARNEWEVLVRAHNDGRIGSPGPIIRPDGSVRTTDDALPPLSSAPVCPLPSADGVFGADSVRPPELEVEADPE